jgi:hypothetical protein
MRSLMKQAQQMQQRLAVAREKLEEETAEATTGGGMVTAVVNGRHELVSLKIKPEAVDPDDVGMLEDMIQGAINEAGRRVSERISAEMAKLTGGMGLPGMF